MTCHQMLRESHISNPYHTEWQSLHAERISNFLNFNQQMHTPINVLPDNRPERSKTYGNLKILNTLLWIKYNKNLCIFWLILWKLNYNAWSEQYKKNLKFQSYCMTCHWILWESKILNSSMTCYDMLIQSQISNYDHTEWHVIECCTLLGHTESHKSNFYEVKP